MTPEFIRKYHIYKILSSPLSFGVNSQDGCVSTHDIADALKDIYVNHQDELLYKACLKSSPKNIKRDVISIEEFFGVEINYAKGKGYCIIDREVNSEIQQLIFDKIELYMASHKEKEWRPYVSPEKSSISSSINIIGLIRAIEQKKWINVVYNGWYDDMCFEKIETKIQPLHLKQCYKAWYLIGYDDKNGVRIYCLDERMEVIAITDKVINKPYIFVVEEYFRDSLGILNDVNCPAEKVVIQVANHHFKYLQSKPLPNQKIIKYPKVMDTESLDYLNPDIWGTIEAFLQPNHELLMEVYKFNLWVKVIEPKWFADKIASQYAFVTNAYYSKNEIKELIFK